MALKSKKELKKMHREKYKELYGDFLITSTSSGAFGKRKIYNTFDPNETNKMRHKKLQRKETKKQTTIETANKLLVKTLEISPYNH